MAIGLRRCPSCSPKSSSPFLSRLGRAEQIAPLEKSRLMPDAPSRIPQTDLRAVESVKSVDFLGSEIMGYGDRRKIRTADLHVVDQADEFEVGVGACILQ